MLFGSVESQEEAQNNKPKSRNQLLTRHTYTYNKEGDDIDNIPDDDSVPEENFDLNINEHDEEILLKSVSIHTMKTEGILGSQFHRDQNKSFAIPELDLEVIKEAEDTLVSPK